MDENNASMMDDEVKEPISEAEVVEEQPRADEEIPSGPKKPSWMKRFMAWAVQ